GARIPLDLYERIMRVSEERGISASDLIKEAATLYLRLLEMAEERGTTVEKLVNAIEKPSESVDYLRGRLDTLERFLMVLLSSKVSLAEARELAKTLAREEAPREVIIAAPPREVIIAAPPREEEMIASDEVLEEILDNPWVSILREKGRER
ncbi:MAG: hypothetical protein QXP84_07595, partial [Candidatus Korarchaeum sp.]